VTNITSADRQSLRRQLKRAASSDPGLLEVIQQVGYPEPRKRSAEFATLLQVITSQQLSTRAAAAINTKISKCCAGNVTWRKVLNRSDQQLRDCGLSWRKVEYTKGLAEMFRNGELNLDQMHEMNSEQAIEELLKVRGFGRWSGEIFAMFALGHTDIYPADDLALQVAVQRYLGLAAKPTGKETMLIAERWSPYRSAVSLLMWKFYGSTTLG